MCFFVDILQVIYQKKVHGRCIDRYIGGSIGIDIDTFLCERVRVKTDIFRLHFNADNVCRLIILDIPSRKALRKYRTYNSREPSHQILKLSLILYNKN